MHPSSLLKSAILVKIPKRNGGKAETWSYVQIYSYKTIAVQEHIRLSSCSLLPLLYLSKRELYTLQPNNEKDVNHDCEEYGSD